MLSSQARIDDHAHRPLTPQFGYIDNDDDTRDNVIAAIDKSGQNVVGCAVYYAREGLLRCMEDIKELGADLFEICWYCSMNDASATDNILVKADIRPTVLLLTLRSEAAVEPELARTGPIDEEGIYMHMGRSTVVNKSTRSPTFISIPACNSSCHRL